MSSLYAEGARLIWPFLHFDGISPSPPNQSLHGGIELLESCRHEDYWEANWLLGKAYEAAGDNVKSARRFGDAFRKQPQRREVAHEYVIALLRISMIDEARAIVEAFANDDPLLTFDRALTLFAARADVEALEILDCACWPEDLQGGVNELRKRITERNHDS